MGNRTHPRNKATGHIVLKEQQQKRSANLATAITRRLERNLDHVSGPTQQVCSLTGLLCVTLYVHAHSSTGLNKTPTKYSHKRIRLFCIFIAFFQPKLRWKSTDLWQESVHLGEVLSELREIGFSQKQFQLSGATMIKYLFGFFLVVGFFFS